METKVVNSSIETIFLTKEKATKWLFEVRNNHIKIRKH